MNLADIKSRFVYPTTDGSHTAATVAVQDWMVGGRRRGGTRYIPSSKVRSGLTRVLAGSANRWHPYWIHLCSRLPFRIWD